jgi:hypothetical protein
VYNTFAELKEGSEFDPAEWDELNARRSATVTAWLGLTQALIDDPLRLRYAVPFGATPPSLVPDPSLAPKTVKAWQIVLMDAKFLRHRRTPGAEAPADSDLSAEAKAVLESIAAAADQDRPAHPELPLRSNTSSSGVSKGGPMMVGYATLYGFFDGQAARRDAGGW